MDLFTQEIHAHRGTDRRDIVGAEDRDDFGKRGDDIFFRDDNFRVFRSDIVGNFFRIFQIDRIFAHTDGESLDRVIFHALGDRTDQGRIQSAGKQKADL